MASIPQIVKEWWIVIRSVQCIAFLAFKVTV